MYNDKLYLHQVSLDGDPLIIEFYESLQDLLKVAAQFLLPIPRTYRDVEGAIFPVPYLGNWAVEKLHDMLNPPQRLVWVPDLFSDVHFRVVYEDALQETERLTEVLLNPSGQALEKAAPLRTRVDFETDKGQATLIVSHRGRTFPTVYLTETQRNLLQVLRSPDYLSSRAAWDEFLWHQIWGNHRTDKKAPRPYLPRVKKTGGHDGPPSVMTKLVSDLNKLFATAISSRDPQLVVREARGSRHGQLDQAYLINSQIIWKDRTSNGEDKAAGLVLPANLIEMLNVKHDPHEDSNPDDPSDLSDAA